MHLDFFLGGGLLSGKEHVTKTSCSHSPPPPVGVRECVFHSYLPKTTNANGLKSHQN